MMLSLVVLYWVNLGSQRHVINSCDTTQMAATKKLTWAQLQVRDQSVAKVYVNDHRSWTTGASWKMNGKHCVFLAASDCVNAKEVGGEEGVAQKEWQNTPLCSETASTVYYFTSAFMPYCYWCKFSIQRLFLFCAIVFGGFMLFRELVDCIAQWQTSACCFLIVWLYNCLGKQVNNKFCNEYT